MNRAQRRKLTMAVANDAIKRRDANLAVPQYGLGFMFTTRVGVITFWRWTLMLWDRRVAR